MELLRIRFADPPRPAVPRFFEADDNDRQVAFSARTLAMLLNVAIRVGRGTETLKALADMVRNFGVRRIS